MRAHVKAYGSIELERAAAGGGFGIAEHYANLFAQLVYEDTNMVLDLDMMPVIFLSA